MCVFRDVLDSEDRKMHLTGKVRAFLASRAVVVGGYGTVRVLTKTQEWVCV